MLSPNQRCHYSDEAEDSRGLLLQSSNFPRGRVKVNSSGSTISASQASPVLPEVIANGRATMKNAVLITVKPNPITRIGISITIAIASGRSSGIAAEACPVTNARKRQLIVKIFRDFVRYMITGMCKFIAGQRLNSPMTGACPVTNARKRQLIVKIFRDFVRYMITGIFKFFAGQILNSPMTGA